MKVLKKIGSQNLTINPLFNNQKSILMLYVEKGNSKKDEDGKESHIQINIGGDIVIDSWAYIANQVEGYAKGNIDEEDKNAIEYRQLFSSLFVITMFGKVRNSEGNHRKNTRGEQCKESTQESQ